MFYTVIRRADLAGTIIGCSVESVEDAGHRMGVWSASALMWNGMHTLLKLKSPLLSRDSKIDSALFAPDFSALLSAERAILV